MVILNEKQFKRGSRQRVYLDMERQLGISDGVVIYVKKGVFSSCILNIPNACVSEEHLSALVDKHFVVSGR